MIIESILSVKGGDVVAVSPTTPVLEVIEILHRKKIGAVLVVDSGAIVGVLSERDIVQHLSEDGLGALHGAASAIMTAPVITAAPDMSVTEAMGLMTSRRIRHLPVMRGAHLVGLVSIGDLVKHRIEEIEREAEALKSYIAAG